MRIPYCRSLTGKLTACKPNLKPTQKTYSKVMTTTYRQYFSKALSPKIFILTILLLTGSYKIQAQPYDGITVNSQIFSDDIWFFGQGWTGSGSPGIKFRKEGGSYVAYDYSGISKVKSWENSLSVSTPSCDGGFVFYTMHDKVYNAKHEVMDGGTFKGDTSVADGLGACYVGNNKYVLTTVSACYYCGVSGMYAYVIDMSANSGLGKMTPLATIETSYMSESTEIIPVAGTTDEYWLVYHKFSSDLRTQSTIYVRKITGNNGNPTISAPMKSLDLPAGTKETYKLETNKTYNRLSLTCTYAKRFYLLHFNPATGDIAFDHQINIPTADIPGDAYGAAFSPDGTYVYPYSWTYAHFWQYNLATKTVSSRYNFTNPSTIGGGGFKVGPDGKMYTVFHSGVRNYVGVIPNPNIPITSVPFNEFYKENGMTIGVTIYSNLPISTGLTPPAIDPPNIINPPRTNPDYAVTTGTIPITVNVLSNDTNVNGTRLYVFNAYLLDPTKSSQGTVTFNRDAGTVTFTPNEAYSFTDGEKVYITYAAQDNGTPIALCESSTLEVTVRVNLKSTNTLFSDNVWFFGQGASGSGGISFKNNGSAFVPTDASGIAAVQTTESSLIVSTPMCEGGYIFYAQHNQVYNSTHRKMAGVTNGAIEGHTSTADGLAASYIGNNRYALFSVNGAYENNSPTYNKDGNSLLKLYYYIVDMNGDNGLGELIIPSGNTIEGSGMSESIELIAKADTPDEYWLVYYHRDSYKLKVKRIQANNGSITITDAGELVVGIKPTGKNTYRLQASPNNNRLALVSANTSEIYVFNFNPFNGEVGFFKSVSYSTELAGNSLVNANSGCLYSVEFSPNGRYLYATVFQTGSTIYQYDLTTNTKRSKAVAAFTRGGGLKLAPDGKIYMALANSNLVRVIEKPDLPADNAGFTIGSFTLSRTMGDYLNFSARLTPPSVDPPSGNNQPVAVTDRVTTTSVTNVVIYPLANDTDTDADQTLYLTDVRFTNPADNNVKGTLAWDAPTASATFTPRVGYPFAEGEKAYLTYSIRDNGTPVALCANGTIEITLISAKLDVSIAPLAINEGESAIATICLANGAIAQQEGLSVSLTAVGTSTATASDYELVGIPAIIPAGESCTTATVRAKSNDKIEPAKTLVLEGVATNFTVGTQATLTINDYTPGDIVIEKVAPATGNLSESSSTAGKFRLGFKNPNVTCYKDVKVTLEWTGSAINGTHYEPVSEVVIIPQNNNSQEISIIPRNNFVVGGSYSIKIEIRSVEMLP